MALKNFLSINILIIIILFFYGCKIKKNNPDAKNNEQELILKKDSSTNIKNNLISNDTNILNNLINNTNDTVILKKMNNKNVSANKSIEGVQPKEGTEYIIYPKARINDSINLFVDNYESLMRTLRKKGVARTNKPILDPIKRDSLLWEEWQKMIKQKDYRHKYVPFDRNTMKFGNKK